MSIGWEAEAGKIFLPFQPDRALAGDRRRSGVRMDRQRAALGDIGVAQNLRIGVGRAFDDDFGAIGLDLGDLRRRSDLRHEDARPDPPACPTA